MNAISKDFKRLEKLQSGVNLFSKNARDVSIILTEAARRANQAAKSAPSFFKSPLLAVAHKVNILINKVREALGLQYSQKHQQRLILQVTKQLVQNVDALKLELKRCGDPNLTIPLFAKLWEEALTVIGAAASILDLKELKDSLPEIRTTLYSVPYLHPNLGIRSLDLAKTRLSSKIIFLINRSKSERILLYKDDLPALQFMIERAFLKVDGKEHLVDQREVERIRKLLFTSSIDRADHDEIKQLQNAFNQFMTLS